MHQAEPAAEVVYLASDLRQAMAIEDQSGLTQLFEHRWSTIDWAIARLTVPLANIAIRNGLVVENWDEDGLGPTAGFPLAFSSNS